MQSDYEIRLIPTLTHGRVLVRKARGVPVGLLVGFHGYMEDADIQMQRLEAIPNGSDWTLVSIQALHRFYRRRTNEVVASWMTRQDREVAIVDNIDYVNAALDSVAHETFAKVVYAGFSQGVAMAFRSAVRGSRTAAGIIGVGGDVPPELLLDPHATFPFVLLARGMSDEWFTAEKFRADVNALVARGGRVRAHEFDGGHEWNDSFAVAAADFLQSGPSDRQG
jgi:predicted esterase